jgi:D-alanyl-D-alanine carboxypeptidase (penicillin-binding protein 5/6)
MSKQILTLIFPLTVFLASIIVKHTDRENFTVSAIDNKNPNQEHFASPTPAPSPIPTLPEKPSNQHPLPSINAKAYQIYDLKSETILAEQNANLPFPPASTTKIMTAIISLENYALTEIITIADIDIPGAKVNLQPGEKITVENLLYGLLLQSGNNVAAALASHYPGGTSEFINAMNQKAMQLQLEKTNYTNPHGLHDPLHLSSAGDLIKLAKYAILNPKFAQIVNTKTKTITGINNQNTHQLINLNQLLDEVEGVKGIKTGWTEQAGESLVTLVDRQNHPLIITILGSQNRFEDTKLLINWAYTHTIWP